MRSLAKKFASWMGVRLLRDGPVRFQALYETLLNMKVHGYSPRIVIDGGANKGQFYRLCRRVFADAHFHLIEPQPVCASMLRVLESSADEIECHFVALTEPGIQKLRLLGGGVEGSTGAYVAAEGEHGVNEVVVPATTLDQLLGPRITEEDRALLKLDLESHELQALRGGCSLVSRCEVVLLEVSFYDINERGRPLFSDILKFMTGKGFVLYDIAALSSRTRDKRLRMGDAVFVRTHTHLVSDSSWE